MADSIFNIIKEDNKKYEKNDYNGKMTSTKNYKVIQGKIPILLSAPHGVKQVRNKKIKWEDAMTGGIVEYLCDTINAFGIIRTCNLNDDPNYNNDSLSLQYKNEINNLIEKNNIVYLFDIHGCSNKYGFDIAIGTNDGNNLSCNKEEFNNIKSILATDFSVAIDTKFKASKPYTISNYIHNQSNITCIQLEISKKVRESPTSLNKFIKSFEKVIYYLNDKYKN